MRAAAQIVRDAGDVVIIWGERVLAGDRGGAGRPGAARGGRRARDRRQAGVRPDRIPAETNGRGLREVGCAAGLGPGLADADGAHG